MAARSSRDLACWWRATSRAWAGSLGFRLGAGRVGCRSNTPLEPIQLGLVAALVRAVHDCQRLGQQAPSFLGLARLAPAALGQREEIRAATTPTRWLRQPR